MENSVSQPGSTIEIINEVDYWVVMQVRVWQPGTGVTQSHSHWQALMYAYHTKATVKFKMETKMWCNFH